ncbi:permease for cytosine/purines, uracil, thiamine, allantoin-domain-containing protein [Thelonectria olida]|uniref:Permease for cytosine/purines, uracil, thiamine, allantoin-domain-containing protein n=1 Tax=Thelonectria olida TaxID=1576542 RepID=A0A9P8W1J2_9HYPO|nr:permease for cytosine/purines, uracil, thiamine, allantoin-domain-containing protein [Thelonectria olida]
MAAPTHDVEIVAEKEVRVSDRASVDENMSTAEPTLPPSSGRFSSLKTLNARIENLAGLESRGIDRVPPEERQPASHAADLQVAVLWFSANLSLNNLATGLFGPMVFGLGFLDSALLAVFGTILGAMSTAYMATWGPRSGNRTMVVLRYFMGYWPAKLPTLLNVVLMVGYTTIDCIIGGQVLSAVSGGSMTILVGVIVVALMTWVIAVFGMAIFHRYERYAWIPQVIVLSVLIGAAGQYFDASAQPTVSGSTLAANRLSFFTLCFYVPNSWAAAASDFYVYYPENTPRIKIFLLTVTGLTISFNLVYLIAIGLATGLTNNQAWTDANAVSTGALIVTAFDPLHNFGRFCSVIIALGVVANSTPSIYSAALGCQVLGRYGKAIPRWVWSSILTLIGMVLAMAGREHLLVIFQNFVALMGYWVMLMIVIVGMEHGLFRGRKAFDWAAWEDKSYLPVGYAAFAAFLLGWVGAILGMSQVWYIGPISEAASLADLGMWLGCGFAIVVFPPLRYLELKVVGR